MEPIKCLLILMCFGVVRYSMQITLIGQKYNKNFGTFCVSKNENETLTWIRPYDESFQENGGESQRNDVIKYIPNTWISENSFMTHLGFVLDPRWQGFNTYVSSYRDYKKVSLKTLFGNFEISFSIRFYNDAEIELYRGYDWLYDTKLNFNKDSIHITICREAKGFNIACKRNANETAKIKSIQRIWNHYSIRYSDNKLQLLDYDQRQLFATQIYGYTLETLEFKSKNGAMLKIHDYKYHRKTFSNNEEIFLENINAFNNKICVSGYYYFYKEISLVLRLDSNVIKEQIYNIENVGWKFIKFEQSIIDEQSYDRFTLWIKYYIGYDVYVSHIKIDSDCEENINKMLINVPTSQLNDLSCAPLNNLDASVQMRGSDKSLGSSCDPNEFGNDCIKCKSVFGTDKCERALTCAETNHCYCAPGYYGLHCANNCREGTFGSNCKFDCGQCKYRQECDRYTGFCAGGCKEWYTGLLCTDVELPYLRETPAVKEPCYTSCVISFKPTLYKGLKEPTTYKLQVFENQKWMEVESVENVAKADIEMTNLDILHQYRVRIVLCHNDGCMEGDMVPELTFTTDCRDITRDMLTERIESRRVSFDFSIKQGYCRQDLYSTRIVTQSRSIQADRLTPNSNYNIQIYRENRLIFEFPITTDQEAPGKIRNVRRESNETSISLFWDPPDESFGRIVNYSITYKLKPTADCVDRLKEFVNPQAVHSYGNSIHLNDLRPHSDYSIQVQAFNRYAGELSYIDMKTKSRDVPKPDSYSIEKTSTTHSSLEVAFKKNCEHIESDVFFSSSFECEVDWCRNITKSNLILNEKSVLQVSELLAFTNYTVKLYMAATRDAQESVLMRTFAITTQPSEPNALRNLDVIAIHKSGAVSIAFDLPHPPTGVLEEIKIGDQQISISERCKIWKDRHCSKLNACPYNKEVSLKNYNVSNYKTYWSYTQCRQGKPEPPKNLQASWDEDFNLILSWEHPLHMNGEFDAFIIENKHFEFRPEENLTYFYQLNETNVCSQDTHSKLSVLTQTLNNKSSSSTVKVTCPPKKPVLEADPHIVERNNNSLIVKLPKFANRTKDSYIHVVVEQPHDIEADSLTCDPAKLIESINKKRAWIALEVPRNFEGGEILIGAMTSNYTHYLNCYCSNAILEMNTVYEVSIILTNIDREMTRRNVYKLRANTTEGASIRDRSVAGRSVNLLYLLLIPLMLILSFFIYKKRHVLKDVQPPKNVFLMRPRAPPMQPLAPEVHETPELDLEQYTMLVKISDFESYVKRCIENNELDKQYETLLNQVVSVPSEYGKLPQNKTKNRYANIVPYDHSRVVLQKIAGDDFSDYINANYIHGLNTGRAYIAAQAPKESTLNDFWRMIWEGNVSHIVMLTNVYEGVKKKSEKYWPDIGESSNFGGIKVTHYSFEVFPDYEQRTFGLTFKNYNRTVEHLHYTTWPDHGVPMYPTSVVPFVRKILKMAQNSSPILVHCSAGVGRTGTIILIDLCLRMVSKIGALDIFYHLKALRAQRPKMVDSQQQYKFAHLVLLECLVTPDTAVPCNENFESLVSNLDIPFQMEYVDNSAWYEEILMKNRIALKDRDPAKDRFPSIFPQKCGLVYLSPIPNEQTSNYINAVSVDSFMLVSRFIVTQQPMPNTLSDFWRLAYEYDIRVIVSLQEIDLNDITCCSFYPNKDLPKLAVNNYSIELSKVEIIESTYKLIWVNMHFNKNQKTLVIIELEGWQYGAERPPNPAAFLNICNETHRLIADSKQILVTCRDGAAGSGLFVALCFLLEKIKLEQICDVCHAVRIIRRSRKEFVRSESQFRFLYEMVDRYLKEFEIYSNFVSK